MRSVRQHTARIAITLVAGLERLERSDDAGVLQQFERPGRARLDAAQFIDDRQAEINSF